MSSDQFLPFLFKNLNPQPHSWKSIQIFRRLKENKMIGITLMIATVFRENFPAIRNVLFP